MYIYLTDANEGRTTVALHKAALIVPWIGAAPVVKDKHAYAELLNTSKDRQSERRRGFVLWSRLRDDPKLELTDAERRLVDEYAEHRRLTDDFSWAEREQVDEVYFGQPQLMTTAEQGCRPDRRGRLHVPAHRRATEAEEQLADRD